MFLELVPEEFMADQKRRENNLSSQSEQKEAVQKEVAAQRDLMGSAAVEPQPLLDEEKDPIAQKAQRTSETK